MWRLSVYLHMYTMYDDYLNMWLLNNIKTMQIYKFAYSVATDALSFLRLLVFLSPVF